MITTTAMFKPKELEKLWFGYKCYKSEGEPTGMSIERYYMLKGVLYRLF